MKRDLGMDEVAVGSGGEVVRLDAQAALIKRGREG